MIQLDTSLAFKIICFFFYILGYNKTNKNKEIMKTRKKSRLFMDVEA